MTAREGTRRPGVRATLSAALGLVLCVAWAVSAQQGGPAPAGVYSAAQADRGAAVYEQQCAVCHAADLTGGLAPPLTGADFTRGWLGSPLWDLVDKIHKTMPANNPGTLTLQQATDIAAHVLRAGKFPRGGGELAADEARLKGVRVAAPAARAAAPIAPVPSHLASFPANGNMAQVMRGIFFPSSNLIFNVQTNDPGAPRPPIEVGRAPFSWVDWGAGIYSGWEIVDYAAIALADAAPLLLTPGRRCENGRQVPVEDADWVQFTREMVDAARVAYKASQSRSQEAVGEASNQLADSCLRCHEVYRDKPGGTTADPSNKAARCVP